jgi:hypothetical protein
MTLLKYPTWGESFSKTIHMLTMIMNEQQTMPAGLGGPVTETTVGLVEPVTETAAGLGDL